MFYTWSFTFDSCFIKAALNSADHVEITGNTMSSNSTAADTAISVQFDTALVASAVIQSNAISNIGNSAIYVALNQNSRTDISNNTV